MLKVLLFVTGLAGGAAGATAWLLSESGPQMRRIPHDDIQARLEQLKASVADARAQGALAQQQTEDKLRHELAAYRRHPNRPGTSSSV